MKTARIYQRVSTEQQNLARQDALIDKAKAEGYYIAGVYKEKASGAQPDRPALNRLIEDIQPGDVIVAEHIDRITRLPLAESEKLIARIKDAGAYLAIPGIIDLSDIKTDSDIARIVLDSVQELLLKLALQIARDDYEKRRQRANEGIAKAKAAGKYAGRRPNLEQHQLILELRKTYSIRETAKLAKCSEANVKRICKIYRNAT